ncbi:hypothetical protein B0H19DRAFT_1258553 [Mycena capillaripes]|nr:hypothetical protein B0H19DRAFT_1258553 [Mycena capillaripes]
MVNRSIPATTLSLFTKRRRAYLACASCRKRKTKCVKLSDVEYTPLPADSPRPNPALRPHKFTSQLASAIIPTPGGLPSR